MEPSKTTKIIVEVLILSIMTGMTLVILALIIRAIDAILEPILILGR